MDAFESRTQSSCGSIFTDSSRFPSIYSILLLRTPSASPPLKAHARLTCLLATLNLRNVVGNKNARRIFDSYSEPRPCFSLCAVSPQSSSPHRSTTLDSSCDPSRTDWNHRIARNITARPARTASSTSRPAVHRMGRVSLHDLQDGRGGGCTGKATVPLNRI